MMRKLAVAVMTMSVSGGLYMQKAAAQGEDTMMEDPTPMGPTDAPPMMEEAPPAAPAASSPVNVSVFADSYYAWQTNDFNGGAPSHPSHRAYVTDQGFALSFAGTDITYDTEHFGATMSVRFGPSVIQFFGDNGPLGFDNLLQGFATWKPSERLSIDFGQFGTIYGAEVAESWQNLNYTRGALYFLMQPFWHTGVRASYAVNDQMSLTGMIVNGVNTIQDDGDALPAIGLQLGYAADAFGLTVGYLGSADPDVDDFDHFIDVVATTTAGKLNLIFNGDFNINSPESGDSTSFYGLSLAAGLPLSDMFGVAFRGEFLMDADNALYEAPGADSVNLITATGTLDFRPFGGENLIIRWDNRFETSSEDIFADGDGAATGTWFQSVLGFVVTSG